MSRPVNKICTMVAVLNLNDNQVMPVLPPEGSSLIFRWLQCKPSIPAPSHYFVSCLLIRQPDINLEVFPLVLFKLNYRKSLQNIMVVNIDKVWL